MESQISIRWTKENLKAVEYRFNHPTKDIQIKLYNFDLFELPTWCPGNCGAVIVRHTANLYDYLDFNSSYVWETLKDFEQAVKQLKK